MPPASVFTMSGVTPLLQNSLSHLIQLPWHCDIAPHFCVLSEIQTGVPEIHIPILVK